MGLQSQYFEHSDLHAFYSGKLAEHIVVQEIMASDSIALRKPLFWVREKRQANAELDIIMQYENVAVPVEVKSGKPGILKSLHSFIDISKCKMAVRLYSGKLKITDIKTPRGTPFTLLDLPYCFASRIVGYLDWALRSRDTGQFW